MMNNCVHNRSDIAAYSALLVPGGFSITVKAPARSDSMTV
jgi:hypothetical protein